MKPDPNDRFIHEVSRTLKAPNAQKAFDWNGVVQTFPRRRLRTFLAAPALGRERNDLGHAVRRLDEAASKRGRKPWEGVCRDPLIRMLIRWFVANEGLPPTSTNGESACARVAAVLWIDGLDVRGVERVWNGRPDGKETRKSCPRDYGGQCADCGKGVTRTRARECRGLGITVRCRECELEFFP